MYSQIEIIWILLGCNTAAELLEYRGLLEETGHRLQCIAFEVYNKLMLELLNKEKI